MVLKLLQIEDLSLEICRLLFLCFGFGTCALAVDLPLNRPARILPQD